MTNRLRNLNIYILATLAIAMAYLGLVITTGTTSPFFVVQGISMEPAYHAGDLLIGSREAPTEIKIGDVIVFRVPPDARERLKLPNKVAHRVASISAENGRLVYTTKGDNADTDAFTISSAEVQATVSKNLGPWGRPWLWVSSRPQMLIFALPALIFMGIAYVGLKLWRERELTDEGEEASEVAQPTPVNADPPRAEPLATPPTTSEPHTVIDDSIPTMGLEHVNSEAPSHFQPHVILTGDPVHALALEPAPDSSARDLAIHPIYDTAADSARSLAAETLEPTTAIADTPDLARIAGWYEHNHPELAPSDPLRRRSLVAAGYLRIWLAHQGKDQTHNLLRCIELCNQAISLGPANDDVEEGALLAEAYARKAMAWLGHEAAQNFSRAIALYVRYIQLASDRQYPSLESGDSANAHDVGATHREHDASSTRSPDKQSFLSFLPTNYPGLQELALAENYILDAADASDMPGVPDVGPAKSTSARNEVRIDTLTEGESRLRHNGPRNSNGNGESPVGEAQSPVGDANAEKQIPANSAWLY